MSENQNKNINISPVPKFIDNALTRITDEPCESIGKTISDIWFLVFGRLRQAADKRKMKYAVDLEIFRRELNKKIEEIPKDKLVEPDLQVVGPALETSKNCIQKEEIRRFFVNLISSSMRSDIKEKVHPFFGRLIEQMSSLEANLFRLFANQKVRSLDLEDIKLFPMDAERLAFSLAMLKQLGLIKEITNQAIRERLCELNKEPDSLFRLIPDYWSSADTLLISISEIISMYIDDIHLKDINNVRSIYEHLLECYCLTELGETFKMICL